jgi:hypothetical protein
MSEYDRFIKKCMDENIHVIVEKEKNYLLINYNGSTLVFTDKGEYLMSVDKREKITIL